MGGPLTESDFDLPIIRDLVVFNGELVACGSFNTISGVAASGIALWNGSVWQPISSGTDPDFIYCVAMHN